MATPAIPQIPAVLEFDDSQKPYVESIGGRLEAKMSPKLIHSLVQTAVAAVLRAWAAGRGVVGTEIRFYFLRESKPSSLLPDVAYISNERLQRETRDAFDRPRCAPDLAIEIWSPGDSTRTLEEKIALYLAHGSPAVIVIDPEARRIEFHRADGREAHERTGLIRVAPYDDLTIDCGELFRDL